MLRSTNPIALDIEYVDAHPEHTGSGESCEDTDDSDGGMVLPRRTSYHVSGRSINRRMKTALCFCFVFVGTFFICVTHATWGESDTFRYFSCIFGLSDWSDKESSSSRCNVYRLDRPPRRGFDCVPLPTTPSPLICVYDPAEDIFISAAIKDGQLWETQIVDLFQELLLEDPALGVIDIGANVGQYSLLAAMMGRRVVAVEAYLRHVEMIQKAVVLNKLHENFTLVYNAVSDVHGSTVALLFKNSNRGAIRIVESNLGGRLRSAPRDPAKECMASGSHVSTITMDDLLEVARFERAIIKIDIEGYEAKVMLQAEMLLKELYVPYIIMEWAILASKTDEYAIMGVETLLDFLHGHKYTAHSIGGRHRLNTSIWRDWPQDIIWKHQRAKLER